MPSLAHLLVFTILSSVAVATPFSHSGPEVIARASSHPTTDLLCLAFNLNTNATEDGSPLTRASTISQMLLECHYSDGEVCSYARGNGSIQTGSSTCPKSIDRSESTESTGFDCNQHHLQNSPLIGNSVTPAAGNLACVYADATLCTYSQHTGMLSTGASLCPLTATGSPECPVSSSGPTPNTGSTKAAAAAAAAAVRSSSDTSTPALSPALIALLVLNGLLVLIVLALGGAWLKRWHAGGGKRYDSKYHALRLGTGSMARNNTDVVYGGVDADRDADADDVPLTHGAPGRYRDESAQGRTSRRGSRERLRAFED